MRSSSFVVFGTFGLLLTALSGCRIEAHTQTAFVDDGQPAKVSTRDWAGEPISIVNDGINPLVGTGGVEVKVDAAATKITAKASFSATADDDKKSDADLSIRDALATFVVEESANGFVIKCGHGGAHGTSTVAASGCKLLTVTIPAGSVAKPHSLTVGNGAGSVRVGLENAGGIGFFKGLTVDNNGLGEVSVRANTVKDAKVVLTGDDAVQAELPAAFSAKTVTFTVDEDDAAKVAARIITTAFPGMVSGSPYPVAGATADAAELLNVTSQGPFASDTITIKSF